MPDERQRFTVRPAAESELARVQELSAALYEWERERDPGANVNWPHEDEGRDYLLSRIRGDGACLVAEAPGGEVIGFLVGAMAEEEWRSVSRTELESMYVDAAWRGTGVGRALIARFLDWSRAAGAQQVKVEAFAKNEPAVRFYEGNGFTTEAVTLNIELTGSASAGDLS